MEEEQRLHQLLMGLNEVYSGVRKNILMLKPLDDVDTAYSMLINDESQLEAHTVTPSFNTDAASFSAGVHRTPYPPRPQYPQKVNFDNKRNNLFYRYCKKPGHVIGNCRKLQHQNVSQPNQHNSHNNTPATSTSYRRSVVASVRVLIHTLM